MAMLRAAEGSPNDEILMGIIGCGGMGIGNMVNFLNIKGVRVVAVCDVDANQMEQAKSRVNGHYKNSDCKTYAHYADLIAHPGLDAVSLATPDHLHAIIGIAAANAGLDIYGEKPFTWGLAEGRALVDAITRKQRVWQTGSWQRSGGEFRRFRALVQNNTLGKITRCECGTPSGMSIRDNSPKEKWAELSKKPPDWVGHHVDIALWSLGLEDTGPAVIEGSGELGQHELFDTYVNYSYKGTYADGRVIEVRSDFGGTKFTGENGWIHVNRGKLDASDREILRNLPADFDTKPPSHQQNFIDCVRSRQTTVSHAEGSHRSSSFGQLAIVAMDSKQPLRWDPRAEKVIDNAEQAAHPRLGARI
jgi:predicted dehydrogenase